MNAFHSIDFALPPRWTKLWKDVRLEKERTALMFTALVTSLLAISVVLGAWQILRREIRTNYLGTKPAQATLEIPGGVDPSLLRWVRQRSEIAHADAADVLQARAKVGEDWLPLLVFVRDSAEEPSLAIHHFEAGARAAPIGTLQLERTATLPLGVGLGDSLTLKLPHAPVQTISVSGIVHDPGLSPATQERSGYAYLSNASLRSLGEDPGLHELRVAFRSPGGSTQSVQLQAERLAEALVESGVAVHEIRVPPLEKHPHQAQMETILLLLLAFAALAFLLSAVLVATTLSAWLARQTRELAILKTLGASSLQIAGIYVAFVSLLGTSSFLVAWPLGVLGARGFAGKIASMLNFTVADSGLSWTHPVSIALAAIAIPVLVALVPILAASRATVRQALADWGASPTFGGPLLAHLPRALRQILRRPARLALSTLLLASSGAIFLTALNVREGWKANLDKIWQTRHYDIEVRFQAPQSDSALAGLARVPGVVAVEPWGWTPASLARVGHIETVHAWPDKGHGSFSLMGIPTGTRLVSFPITRGRRLVGTDTLGVVLNHIAWAQAGRPEVGSPVVLGVDDRILSAPLVGVWEEVGSPAIAYLGSEAFKRFQDTRGCDRMIRVVTSARSPGERSEILRALEAAIQSKGMPVQVAVPFSELRTAIGDHLKILVGALLALAGVIGLVGMLGTASVTGMGVLERTREFGVLKTLGATPDRILRMVLAETLATGLLSWAGGCLLAWPLTVGLDRLIGSLGFLAPLPLVFHPAGPIAWLAMLAAITVISGWLPARRAGRLTVREALVQV